MLRFKLYINFATRQIYINFGSLVEHLQDQFRNSTNPKTIYPQPLTCQHFHHMFPRTLDTTRAFVPHTIEPILNVVTNVCENLKL